MELKNDHNVYLLGAGFSVDAGLPLIGNFLLRMRDSHEWLLAQGREREANAVEQVLRFRLEASSASYWVSLDLENIEELFSLASASTGSVASHTKLAIAATLDYCRKVGHPLVSRLNIRDSAQFAVRKNKFPSWLKPESVDSSVQHNEGRYTLGTYAFFIARLLGMFDDGVPKGQNTFITFNYDTLVEEGLSELQLPYSHSLASEPGTVAKITGAEQKRPMPVVPVLKLHGSVTWARAENAKDLRVFRTYDEVLAAQLVPELVPPTWKKIFGEQLEHVWEQAIKNLRTATRIIIIGFSMPPADMHFKYLIAAGLQNNVSLREIIFVNPDDKNELESRVGKIFRQAYVDTKRIRVSKTTLYHFTYGHPNEIENLGRPRERGMIFDVHHS